MPPAPQVGLKRLALQLMGGVVVTDEEAVSSEQWRVARGYVDSQDSLALGVLDLDVDEWCGGCHILVQPLTNVGDKAIEILEQFR
jgi:hypothetical protein